MTYSKEPLHQILLNISKQVNAPISFLFYDTYEELVHSDQSVSEITSLTIKKNLHKLALKQKEIELLLQFTQTLGSHNLSQQLKQISLVLVHLHHELSDALAEEKRFASLFRSLGVLTGLLLVLILI